MEKYSRLHDLVATVPEIELLEAPSATDTQILYAHDPGYLIKVLQGNLSPREQREIGFPWSEQMVERSRRSSGATVAAAKTAFKEGIADLITKFIPNFSFKDINLPRLRIGS